MNLFNNINDTTPPIDCA